MRYAFERALLQAMIPKGAPILGICRGAQMINDVRGGTCTNLDGKTTAEHHQGRKGISGDQATHAVRLSPASRIANWIGLHRIEVNSFHRQAVSRLGTGLKAVGWSEEDGVIEVFEGVDHPWLMGCNFTRNNCGAPMLIGPNFLLSSARPPFSINALNLNNDVFLLKLKAP